MRMSSNQQDRHDRPEDKMTQENNNNHRQRFASREERAREEALCNRYRGIGIQAVAAAKCAGLKPAQHLSVAAPMLYNESE